MRNETDQMWKEAVMTKLKILSWHLPYGTEEKSVKTIGKDSRSEARSKLTLFPNISCKHC